MTKWYFMKNWERTGQGYTPAELTEMILQKKIRRHRNLVSDDGTGTDVGGVIGIPKAPVLGDSLRNRLSTWYNQLIQGIRL